MPEASQGSEISGHGNVVVQIVGDGNALSIAGARPLRLVGYRDAAHATAPVQPGRRGEPGWTETGRRETRILYPYNRDSLPFQGRAALRQDLRDWLSGSDEISVHALLGGGGRGKTRLAVDLIDAARDLGWTAGFARQEDLAVFRSTGCRTDWTDPTLVVVDYAAAKHAEIGAWLRALAVEEAREAPLRLLLIERTGGPGTGWWREIFERPDPTGEAVADLLAPGAPVTLGPLSAPEERHAVFAAAWGQACERPVPEATATLDRVLAEASLGGEPLFLAMFGLTAARLGLSAAEALPADRIASDLARQELLRIEKVWRAHGLDVATDRPLHAHLAAAAVLCEGLDEAAAHEVIAEESAALNQAIAPGATEQARAALHAALPGEAGGIAAILPDILGEAAVIEALKRLPDSGVETVRRLSVRAGVPVTTMVIRACQDFLVRGRPTPMAWLEALRAGATDLEALMALSDAMPHDTTELREIAAELYEEILRKAGDLEGDERDALRSAALNNLSVRLAELGCREDALAASEEAVEIRRALAVARPDAFTHDLASSLNNLSIRLGDLGRREDALAAIEEAVDTYKALAAVLPDAFTPDLASSLNNLSNCLGDLGRREHALAAIEEAVDTYRALAAARPDAFTTDLAMSLNNLSNRLADLGRREDALAAIEEAVDIRRALAAARPDAFTPDLARFLNNLSIRLGDLGRREDALAAIEEAVDTYKALAAVLPDAFTTDLARSLNNFSIRLADLGRREHALAAIEEAVDIRRALAAAQPDAFNHDLASSLNNLSGCLADLGRREDALAAIEEAVDIYRALAAARPDAFTPDLARSLSNFSGHLADLGRREDALAAIEEAVATYRALAAARPDAFAEPLATSLWVLADRLDEQQRPIDAGEANRAAIEALAPLFHHHGEALAPKIDAMAGEYIERCNVAGVQPDERLMESIAEALSRFHAGIE